MMTNQVVRNSDSNSPVTDRKREQFFSDFITHATDGIAIHQLVMDPLGEPVDYIILEANSAYQTYTGLSIKDIIGKKMTEVLRTNDPAFINLYSQVVSSAESVSFQHSFKPLQRPCKVRVYALDDNTFAVVISAISNQEAATISASFEDKFKSVVDHENQAILIIQGKHLCYANQAAAELLGYTTEQLGKTSLIEIVYVDDRDAAMQAYRSISRGEADHRFSFRVVTSDNVLKWIEFSGSQIVWDDKLGVVGFLRDITETKETEKRLQGINRYFEAVTNAINNPLQIVDRNLVLVAANQQLVNRLRSIGITSSLIGKRLDEIWGTFPLGISERYERVFKRGEALVSEESAQFDEIDYNCETTRYPIFDGNGTVSHVLAIFRNITERKHAEDQNRFLSNILLNMYDSILVTDKSFKITYINKKAEELFGYTLDELKGKTPEILNAEPLAKEIQQEIYKTVAAGGSYSRTAQNRRKDGSTFICEYRVTPLIGEDGEPYAYVGIQRDITERKHAEQQLAAKTEELERYFTSSLDLLSTAKTTGEFIRINPQWEKTLGYSVQELAGRSFLELVHPQDSDSVLASINKLGTEGDELTFEKRFRCQDGSYRWLEWRSRLKDGTIYSVARDITSRKEMEATIIKEREKLANVIAATNVGVWEWNVQTGETYNNERWAEIVGYSCEELSPITVDTWPQLSHPKDFEKAQAQLTQVLNGEREYYDIEFRMKHQAGHWVWVHSRGKVVCWTQDGKPLIMSGTHTDISERKQMEKELQKNDKLESIGLLAGGIAHDLNNYLATLLGNITLARLYEDKSEKILEKLAAMEKAIIRAKDLSNQLFTFSSGAAPLKVRIPIKPLVIDTIKFVLSGSNVLADFLLQDDLYIVEADEGQLSQVLNNIAINAMHAMPGGGILRVSAENMEQENANHDPLVQLKEGSYVRLTIQDEGVGISEEILPKIFDPFFTTKKEGRGLGLAICYSIIKNHGGHLQVESEVGVGTSFHIFLPASSDIETRSYRERGIQRGTGRILVMDDEEGLRTIISEALSACGYQVAVAREGREAIDMYMKALSGGEPFDLVVMDLTIPGGMGGKTAIKELLRQDKNAKVIVSSGYSSDAIMADFTRYGFCGAIKKPFTIEELSRAVSEVLNQ